MLNKTITTMLPPTHSAAMFEHHWILQVCTRVYMYTQSSYNKHIHLYTVSTALPFMLASFLVFFFSTTTNITAMIVTTAMNTAPTDTATYSHGDVCWAGEVVVDGDAASACVLSTCTPPCCGAKLDVNICCMCVDEPCCCGAKLDVNICCVDEPCCCGAKLDVNICCVDESRCCGTEVKNVGDVGAGFLCGIEVETCCDKAEIGRSELEIIWAVVVEITCGIELEIGCSVKLEIIWAVAAEITCGVEIKIGCNVELEIIWAVIEITCGIEIEIVLFADCDVEMSFIGDVDC